MCLRFCFDRRYKLFFLLMIDEINNVIFFFNSNCYDFVLGINNFLFVGNQNDITKT